MKITDFVTLLAATVLMLASSNTALANTSANTQNSTTTATSNTKVTKPAPVATTPDFNISVSISRSTSLIDFQDGTRSDSMDYSVSPSLKVSFGTFSTVLAYSQNLRDEYTKTASDWSDIPVSFSFNSTKFKLTDEQNARISYSLTAVIPNSQYSVKKDQLQTSLSGKIGFSVAPIGDGFSYGVGVSLGRNFHAYEEDINGSVLNQYSSNQSLSLGYGMGDWSIGADFINRTRLTYKGNTKSSFEISEELGYSVSEHFSVAIGHSNGGSTLKPNGTDSNIDIYNENNSTVYGSLGLSY
ncbi:MAG: hypothetical protein ABL930_02260 [Pseudobdellovibrio sp.]